MTFIKKLKTWFSPPKRVAFKIKCPNGLLLESDKFDSDANVAHLKKRALINKDDDSGNDGSNEKINATQSSYYSMFNRCESNSEGEDDDDHDDDESPLDKFISRVVRFTGSIYMFFFMWMLLIGWIIWGVISGGPDNWQIVMQDGQSIQTYVWDTLLMRQQLDDTDGFLKIYGKLKSRSITHKRLLRKLQSNDKFKIVNLNDNTEHFNYKSLTWFDKLSNKMSDLLGSLPSVVIYWIGIFIWIGFGSKSLNIGDGVYQAWSNKWQMFINTATAVELLVTSVFLENIRTRNNDFMRDQLEIFAEFDSKLELISRLILNNDLQENPIVEVKPCPRVGVKKYISKYSDIIGTGIGMVISICVFTTWLCIGPVMKWNDNWWLIIGTYTGLVGFIDGFVLREVFFSITSYEEEKFQELLHDSQELLDFVGIQAELQVPKAKTGFINKISLKINEFCSTDWSVIFSIFLVIALLIIASALKWSTTGQLLANTPTMIIEGFFLLILIQAHNWADDSRSEILVELTKSRRLLYNYVVAYIPNIDQEEEDHYDVLEKF